MNFLTQASTFPAVVLPAFIVAAFFLAVLLRRRNGEPEWHYRDVVVAVSTMLALGCAALSVSFIPRNIPEPQEASAAPTIEVEMLISSGAGVDFYLNDWQHPPERVPVVADERHVYRFTKVPHDISLWCGSSHRRAGCTDLVLIASP